ncbi:MAG: hypothetical protein LBJ64_00025 [Deltaproteobacteria bacterium]|jgi:nucleoside phosphorylase|nr:hypothetical protein [Deltaproteobacteria bacterium]
MQTNRQEAKEIIILSPTPNEYRSVSAHVGRASFRRLNCSVVECGPGRICASYVAAGELAARRVEKDGAVMLVGAGTSGSLSLELKSGDVIVSDSAVISDWRMEEGEKETVSPYGWFDYREPDPAHVEKMVIRGQDARVRAVLSELPAKGFKLGRMLTSEAFICGREHKLNLGRRFGCLACDMESGAFAFIGNRLAKVPWFNIRVVADDLDEALNDYFAMEKDVTEILGQKVVEVLEVLDKSFE